MHTVRLGRRHVADRNTAVPREPIADMHASSIDFFSSWRCLVSRCSITQKVKFGRLPAKSWLLNVLHQYIGTSFGPIVEI